MSSRVLSAIALILFLLSGYLFYSNTQLKKVNKQQATTMLEMEKVQNELDSDYQAALESIESLRTDNQELSALIDNQKEELIAQKAKINNLIWTKRELGKAREEIAEFETLTAGYLVQISDLKSSIDDLNERNAVLTGENEALAQNLNVEKDANEKLQQARAILVSEKQELEENKAMLEEKVGLGSGIKINWMNFEGGELNDESEFKRKKRTKKVKVMRTCFRTETNMVVPAGEETFLLRIINPNGETLASDESGSGTVTNKMTGESMRYTMSGTLTYNNEDTEACMDWTPNHEIMKGEYTVEIFNKDYKVGTGKFKL